MSLLEEESLQELIKVADTMPEELESKRLMKLGNLMSSRQEYKEAEQLFMKALEYDQHDLEIWFYLCSNKLFLGDNEIILEVCDRVPAHQDYPSFHMLKACALNEMQRFEDALKSFDTALELAPGDIALIKGKAVILAKLGDHVGALTLFTQSIALGGLEDPDILDGIGCELLKLNEPTKGLFFLDKAVKLSVNKSTHWFNKGVALSKLDREQDALTCFNKAIALNPEKTEYWGGLGNCLLALSDYLGAYEAFTKAITLDDKSVEDWIGKGLAAHGLGLYNEAIEAFEFSDSIEPRATAWWGKGVTLQAMKEYDSALRALDHSVQCDETYSTAYSERAKLLCFTFARHQEALRDIRLAINLGHQHTKDWLTLAYITAGLQLPHLADMAVQCFLSKSTNAYLVYNQEALLAILSHLNRPLLTFRCFIQNPSLRKNSLWVERNNQNSHVLWQWFLLCRTVQAFILKEPLVDSNKLPSRVLRTLGLIFLIYGDRRSALEYFSLWREKEPDNPAALYFWSTCEIFMQGGIPNNEEEKKLLSLSLREARRINGTMLRPNEENEGRDLHLALILAKGDSQDQEVAQNLLLRHPQSPICLAHLAAMAEEDDRPYVHYIERCFEVEQSHPEKAFLGLGSNPCISRVDVPEATWEDLILRVAHCQRFQWLEEVWGDVVGQKGHSALSSGNTNTIPDTWSAPKYLTVSPEAERDLVLIPALLDVLGKESKRVKGMEDMLSRIDGLSGQGLMRELDYHVNMAAAKDMSAVKVRSLVFHCYSEQKISLADTLLYLHFIFAHRSRSSEVFNRYCRRVLFSALIATATSPIFSTFTLLGWGTAMLSVPLTTLVETLFEAKFSSLKLSRITAHYEMAKKTTKIQDFREQIVL